MAMQYDYYAFEKEHLIDSLNKLELASEKFKKGRKDNNKTVREQAENEINKAATDAVRIEPHLSYLWYEALNSDLKNPVRDAWQKNLTTKKIPEDFRFIPNISELENLPALSFMLRVPFKLQKPYLSKDDRSFHLLDNPVRKDKVFQTPMVASTSWKGALHNAMLQQLAGWWCGLDEGVRKQRQQKKEFVAKRVSIGRLFGTEKGLQIDDKKFDSYLDNLGGNDLVRLYQRYIRRYLSSTGFFSGRLYFYPTFFDQIDWEVINPHDRKKGTGKNPILIESVPIRETGKFMILYVPFGAIDESQVAKDLEIVAEGVKAMLTVYGFGAKTSSGFGIVEDQLDSQGELAIRADIPELKPPEPEVKLSEPDLPRYLVAPGQIDPDFLNPDGTFKSKEQYLQGKSGKKAGQLYDKAKKWWDNERPIAETAILEIIPEPKLTPKPAMTEVSFNKLSELGDRAKEIANHLHQRKEISHDS
jgi:CRISPR-associated protein Cmr2